MTVKPEKIDKKKAYMLTTAFVYSFLKKYEDRASEASSAIGNAHHTLDKTPV